MRINKLLTVLFAFFIASPNIFAGGEAIGGGGGVLSIGQGAEQEIIGIIDSINDDSTITIELTREIFEVIDDLTIIEASNLLWLLKAHDVRSNSKLFDILAEKVDSKSINLLNIDELNNSYKLQFSTPSAATIFQVNPSISSW